MTIWILNSAVLAAGAYGHYRYTPTTIDDLTRALRAGAVSRVGYPETAAVIERWTGIRPALSREPSPLAVGDVAFVVRLRYRVDARWKGAPSSSARPDDDWELARLERVS